MLLYTMATVFQLYLGGDMMYEMRSKPESTLLPTQLILNIPHHIGMHIIGFHGNDRYREHLGTVLGKLRNQNFVSNDIY